MILAVRGVPMRRRRILPLRASRAIQGSMFRFRAEQAPRALAALQKWFAGEGENTSLPSQEPTLTPEARALALFQSVANEVPAYGRFLRQSGVSAASITSSERFRDVPA